MKEIFTQEMNEKEIKESIKLFKKFLSAYNVEWTHANPTQENCYISSSDIIGVYFPNTQFKRMKLHSQYNICSLSKVGGELGLVWSLRDDNELTERAKLYFENYIFEDFITLIYGQSFKRIKKKIESRINDYKKDFSTLKKITRVYKKDGGEFADLLRNFEGANIRLDFSLCSPIVNSIKINYDQIYIYRDDKDKELHNFPTVEELERLINQKMDQYEGYIEREKDTLKNLENNFFKFRKLCDQMKAFRNSVPNWYDYKNEFDYMTL